MERFFLTVVVCIIWTPLAFSADNSGKYSISLIKVTLHYLALPASLEISKCYNFILK